MKYLIGAIFAAVLLTACDPEPTMPMYKQTGPAIKGQTYARQSVRYTDPNVNANVPTSTPYAEPERFVIVQTGIFSDSLAYGSRRGIYIIKDRKTGKEFVGVSGIGISETGSHSNGKTTSSDER